MKRFYSLLATAALSLSALTASAELISGHHYTIRPYTETEKFLCVSSASDWKSSNSETRKLCVVYTNTPTLENGGYWTLGSPSNGKWNLQPQYTTSYGSTYYLNPRTGNNVGNDSASGGNSAWTITPVAGKTDVYTLVNQQGRRWVYDKDQTHPRWAEADNANPELNYFVLTDLDAGAPEPEPEPVVDYSKHLPQLTTDVNNPIWYTMKSAKYGDYAQVVGPTSYMSLVSEPGENCRFYFTGTVAKDANGNNYYSKFIIHTEYASLEGKGLDGRNKWAKPGREYEAAGVKYGDYEGVTIYRGTTNNILAWSDTNSLCQGLHVDYSDDSSDNSKEARVWVFELAVPAAAPATLGAADPTTGVWYGTYFADYDWTIDDASVTVSVVSSVGDGEVTLTPVTGVVPAGTGVVLSATGLSAAKEVAVKKATGTYTPATIGSNLLRGTMSATTVNAAAGESLYKLSFNSSRTKIGFYWDVADGAQLNAAAGKAYLAVPNAAASNGLSIRFETLTGINQVGTTAAPAALPIKEGTYNLNGQAVGTQVRGSQTIVVKNGRKMIRF